MWPWIWYMKGSTTAITTNATTTDVDNDGNDVV